MGYEENDRNPTITKVERINVRHHFVVRYLDNDMKKQMREIILELINKHEIADFFIEESKAYQRNRIIYNGHTLLTEEDSFRFGDIDKRFVNLLN